MLYIDISLVTSFHCLTMSSPIVASHLAHAAVPHHESDLGRIQLEFNTVCQRLNDLMAVVTNKFEDNVYPVFHTTEARFVDKEAAVVSQQAMGTVLTTDGQQSRALTTKCTQLEQRIAWLEAQIVQSGQAMERLTAGVEAFMITQAPVSSNAVPHLPLSQKLHTVLNIGLLQQVGFVSGRHMPSFPVLHIPNSICWPHPQ